MFPCCMIVYGNAERKMCNCWIFEISKVPASQHADCWCSSGPWAPPRAITPAPSPNCSHCLRTDAANLACRPSDDIPARVHCSYACLLLLSVLVCAAESRASNVLLESRSLLIYSEFLALHITWKFKWYLSHAMRSTFKCELLRSVVSLWNRQ